MDRISESSGRELADEYASVLVLPADGDLLAVTVASTGAGPRHRACILFYESIRLGHGQTTVSSLAVAAFVSLLRSERWILHRHPRLAGICRIHTALQKLAFRTYWLAFQIGQQFTRRREAHVG